MSLFQNKKIPDLSWPIGEVGKAFVDEKMVDVLEYFNGVVQVEPVYYNAGYKGAIDKCIVREGVAKKT